MTAMQYKKESAIIRAENAAQSQAITTVFDGFVNLVRTYRERASTRRQLECMSQKMLEDIGISRYEAMREADKPFWKA